MATLNDRSNRKCAKLLILKLRLLKVNKVLILSDLQQHQCVYHRWISENKDYVGGATC